MKTFKDLEFKERDGAFGGAQARMEFGNGYGVSVITGGGLFTDGADSYELAVLDKEGHLCYSTPVTDDVLGYISSDDVTEYMKQVQGLPAAD